MKILWVTNVPVQLNKDITRGGWMQGALQGLLNESDIEVANAYPGVEEIIKEERISYYAFPKVKKYDLHSTEVAISGIIDSYEPDIIHIWGTEYPHSLIAVNAAEKKGKLSRTIISIQGLVSEIAKVYYAGVPIRYQMGWSLKELYKRQSLRKEKRDFEKRGKFEIEALKKVQNVIGRTELDKACIKHINPNCRYFFCNETLREPFYGDEKWHITNIEMHSIFVSQAGLPIKSLHQLFKMVDILQKRYSDIKVYVAGPDKFCNKISRTGIYGKLPARLRRDSYENYLFRLAKEYDIVEKIIFLNELNAYEMHDRYLKSHVFVSPSIIENSPNSVSEAKILGVPCISSYVGGVPGRIDHGKNGFFYPWNEPGMLAHYIQYIFENPIEMEKISQEAIISEEKICSREINTRKLEEIYNTIANERKGL